MSGIDHTPDESDTLMHELERARVVPDSAVPNDIVRMGSVVFYRTASGEQRAVQIVLPKDADIAQGRISIMTPVGIALIGLRTGSSISWRTRNGRKEVLTVLGVVGPRGGGDPGPIAA
jgi:regulator of nucleoside diphosphate kinase